LNGFGYAKNLADVDVFALWVDLGVVQEKDGRVRSGTAGDGSAGIISLDNVGFLAVLPSMTEAEIGAGFEVSAF